MNIRDFWMQRQMQSQQQPTMVNPAVSAAENYQSNPISDGASSAISATRQSLLAKEPKPGFMQDLLGSALRGVTNLGISRMRGSHLPQLQHFGYNMQTPEEQEKLRMQQNLHIMRSLAEQKAKEEQLAFRERQHQEQMRFREQELEESRRHHQAMEGARSVRANDNAPFNEINGFNVTKYPTITTKQQQSKIFNKIEDAREALEFVKSIKKDFDRLKKISDGDIISPTGTDVPFAYGAQEFLSRHGADSFKEPVALREQLKSKFSQVEPVLEKGLKGSSAGEQLIKRFHKDKVYFNIGQAPNILDDRLNDVINRLEKHIKRNSLMMVTKRVLPESLFENTDEEDGHDTNPTKAEYGHSSESHTDSEIPLAAQKTDDSEKIINFLKAHDPNLSDNEIAEALRISNGK